MYILPIRIYNEVAIIAAWNAATMASNKPIGSIPGPEIPTVLEVK
jgi:hypothetical protein